MLNSLHVARQVEPIWSYQVQALWCLLRQDRWFFAVLGEAFTSNEFKWHIWHIIKNTIGVNCWVHLQGEPMGLAGGVCGVTLQVNEVVLFAWDCWMIKMGSKVGAKICNIHAHYTSSTRIVPNLDHWNIKIRLWRQSIQVSGEVCETTPHDIPAENSETLPQFNTCRWHTWLLCPKAWFHSVSFDRQLCSTMSGHSLSVYRRLVVSVWPSPRVRSAKEPAVAPWHTQAGYTSRSSAFQYHYYVWSSWIVPAKLQRKEKHQCMSPNIPTHILRTHTPYYVHRSVRAACVLHDAYYIPVPQRYLHLLLYTYMYLATPTQNYTYTSPYTFT